MQRFDDPTQAIRVATGETFAIALVGNPSTGYTWQVDVDVQYLELLAQEFEPKGRGVGAVARNWNTSSPPAPTPRPFGSNSWASSSRYWTSTSTCQV